MTQIIDPHLHLFNLRDGHYQWLQSSNPPLWPGKQLINRSFVESDLTLNSAMTLAGFVHIEAGFDNQQPWREIDWLEQHCSLPFKSVAFADIAAATFSENLNKLKKRPSVVGIRHVLDEQAAELLSSVSIHNHFTLLGQHNFSFDAQLSLADQEGIECLTALSAAHPRVKIIINHGGYPLNCSDVREQNNWLQNLQRAANQPNIAIKLSGWEMSDANWQPKQVLKVLQDCLDSFGESRVMLASNFPVCLLSHSFAQIWQTYAALAHIGESCFEKITFSNAKNWYRLTED